tara:strand:- start:4143 stop:4802 length:660 start_codon:yes stop_codon:yes gene_type:complete
MKLIFSFLIIIFFSTSILSGELKVNYLIKTKGINIGSVSWDLNISEKKYKTILTLKSNNFISNLYKFRGGYETSGIVVNGFLEPELYIQSWVTKKKHRDVKINFKNNKVKTIEQDPFEREFPRFNFKELYGYVDPLSSFMNILLGKKESKTMDGRRAYILIIDKKNTHKKIIVEEYINLWTDHKKRDLDYLEFYKEKKEFFPKKINIKFKGSFFSLVRN